MRPSLKLPVACNSAAGLFPVSKTHSSRMKTNVSKRTRFGPPELSGSTRKKP